MKKQAHPSYIALYGGNFDPPHRGHLLAISAIMATSEISQVWVVPSADRPDKTASATKADRLAMLNLLLSSNFQDRTVRLEPCQIQGEVATSYTIDLMRHLQAKYPEHSFLFCLGCELLNEISSWKDSATLCANYQFLVLPRPGHSLAEKLPANFKLLTCDPNSLLQISSSQIRQCIKNKAPWKHLVTGEVAEYISAKQLYLR